MATTAAALDAHVRELAHTADVGFEIMAPTLAGAVECAALAVGTAMADLGSVEPRETRPWVVEGTGVEDVVQAALAAVVVLGQTGALLPAEAHVETIDATGLRGWLRGEAVDQRRHALRSEVKAVTYHRLAVHETADGWYVCIIVDV